MMKITEADISKLAQVVREETGNQVQQKNYSMLESRIRSHISKLGLATMQEYWAHYAEHELSEREVLRGLMTTHYTFFFREFAHFELLEDWINENIQSIKDRYEKSRTPFKLWCAACSRGQEPYSLAMFLEFCLVQKYGVPYLIYGTDIDGQSVDYARNGVYPLKEVNTIPQRYVGGFWKKGTGRVKDFAAVHPNLKSKTQFEALNLLELKAWNGPKDFDVIFCRNVFIYFSEENVKKMSLEMRERLNSTGLFVSGMSEPLRFPEWEMAGYGPSCYSQGGQTKKPHVAVVPTVASAPRPQGTPATPVAPVPVAPVAVAREERYSVLCVDDSPTIQALMKKIFAQDPNCIGCDIAGNGRIAREKLDQKKYDLITLDIHMPEVDGIQFLEKFYNKKQDPPVLMVSSVNRSDVDLATKSMRLGAFDYVEKPAMNNLAKSMTEIHLKAKMALRAQKTGDVQMVQDFNDSISQKIVVPDASVCLRMVLVDKAHLNLLTQVIKNQSKEARSPGLVILCAESDATAVEGEFLNMSDKVLTRIREKVAFFRPNSFYVCDTAIASSVFQGLRCENVSVQVLTPNLENFSYLSSIPNIQLLVDENLQLSTTQVESICKLRLSDSTPATSFPSLSLEFFASLRKAAA